MTACYTRQRGSAITENHATFLSQLKSCQLLHDCTKIHIGKDLQQVNDFACHSRSPEIVQFNRPRIISY